MTTKPNRQASAATDEISFARLISTSISARLLVDIGVQMFNPFLPIFAAGLKTDVVAMGRLVSLRSAMGILAPVFGSLADRVGYRRVMRVALLTGAVGMVIIGASNQAWSAAIGMVLIGLSLAGFTPTLQAYLSARLPYAKRARGMGMLEYSWALTGIIGLSLMGQLIAATNWRVPFFVLAGGMVVMAFIFRSLPAAQTASAPTVSASPPTLPARHPWRGQVRNYFQLGSNAVSTYATMAAGALAFYAAVQFMIVHGAWYNDQYGLGPRELGLVALLFGVFDLIASVSVSLFTDRFGKKRSVLLGNIGALLGYVAIPFLNVGVLPAVISTAFARGFFEVAIVANLPLLSEQAPHRRGQIMTLSAAISLGAGTLATFVAPMIYTSIGINGVAWLSTACTVAALVILTTRVREQGS